MKILITGFDPFGGADVNPAYEAVKKLPDRIEDAEIIKLEIPTVFKKDGEVLEKAIKDHQPDIVLCIGQAGGRSGISVEKAALNLMEARIPDNDGWQPFDQPVYEDGQNAYFATIPVKAIVKEIRERGIPANVSYTAGTFVCNDIMYRLLYMADHHYPHMKGGFIHVPYLPEQAVNLPDGTPTMTADVIAEAIQCAVQVIVTNEEDVSVSMGTTH